MARKRYEVEQEDEEWDLTPMIDIVFLLIAFFMVVAKLIDDSKVEIEVPVADQALIPEESPDRVNVTISADGTVYYTSIELANPDDLTGFVESALSAKGETLEIYVRADARTQHQHVRDVMRAIAAGGVYNIKFAAFEN